MPSLAARWRRNEKIWYEQFVGSQASEDTSVPPPAEAFRTQHFSEDYQLAFWKWFYQNRAKYYACLFVLNLIFLFAIIWIARHTFAEQHHEYLDFVETFMQAIGWVLVSLACLAFFICIEYFPKLIFQKGVRMDEESIINAGKLHTHTHSHTSHPCHRKRPNDKYRQLFLSLNLPSTSRQPRFATHSPEPGLLPSHLPRRQCRANHPVLRLLEGPHGRRRVQLPAHRFRHLPW